MRALVLVSLFALSACGGGGPQNCKTIFCDTATQVCCDKFDPDTHTLSACPKGPTEILNAVDVVEKQHCE
jgi:hypothetical protein